jgi:hypothetical protein
VVPGLKETGAEIRHQIAWRFLCLLTHKMAQKLCAVHFLNLSYALGPISPAEQAVKVFFRSVWPPGFVDGPGEQLVALFPSPSEDVHPSQVTRQVRELERLGLVQITADAADGRIVPGDAHSCRFRGAGSSDPKKAWTGSACSWRTGSPKRSGC